MGIQNNSGDLFRQLIALAASLLVLVTLGRAAYADPSCNVTYNVDPDKVIVSFDWVPGTGGGLEPMSCVAAETLRSEIFQSGLDTSYLASQSSLVSELEALLREIDRKNQELKDKLKRDEVLTAGNAAAKSLIYSLSKAGTIVACLSPDPFTKVFCFAGIAGTAYGTHALLTGDFSEPVTLPDTERVQSDLDRLRRAKQELEAKLDDEYLASMRNQQYDMFVALCHAVRENCL